jgi:hypothetical protein
MKKYKLPVIKFEEETTFLNISDKKLNKNISNLENKIHKQMFRNQIQEQESIEFSKSF